MDWYLNREHRKDVAVSVLQAIDVDEYLIDAVRNASPEKTVTEPVKPPVPPEPKGDYLLREPSGQISIPVQNGVLMRQDDAARLYWNTLFHYHGAELKVYRPEPSAEHVNDAIEEFAEVVEADCGEWDAGTLRSMLREFVSNLRVAS